VHDDIGEDSVGEFQYFYDGVLVSFRHRDGAWDAGIIQASVSAETMPNKSRIEYSVGQGAGRGALTICLLLDIFNSC